ncbi:Fsr [Desulforapulum autotrophicum HRM2]|uniref:Fsr n=1 Tax=Desulforapulum autotrophicum (strain ATCC 43914 / DSM 3382 / VKM B-1955 / HRM2) TaxID=177437 RepID=C0QDL2_DESAH|nr:MFS transporter [Desulforapulum autotrophicum]ACN15276.1 Fsr [Desulforapulum autotrophicum HRM2]
MTENTKLNVKVVAALTLVHFTGDFYSSFTSPLLPVYVDKLALSMAQVGLLTGMIRLLAFVVQPCVGYLADRYQTRAFILWGVFLTVTCIPFSGIAPNFYVLMAVLAAGSAGSSMFHPSVTGMLPLYSGPRRGLCMSIFNTGGTLSFAIGPVFISWYVGRFSLEAMPWTMVLGLMSILFCLRAIPMPVSEGMQNSGFWGSLNESLGHVWKPISLIWIVMVLRAVAGQSFITFMPIFLVQKGYDLISVGFIVSLFILAGTVSGLLSGSLSDSMGFKRIFFVTHLLMTPALLAYLFMPGAFVYAGAFIGGFFALATMPLGVLMAQRLAPKGRSMVSSLMMGLAYGLGGLFSPLVGKLADIYSIETVLFWTAFVPLITLIPIVKFPQLEKEA